MPKITINGQVIEVDESLTLMQACESVGIEIPHFCYHERLSIVGNCRMCLVDVEGEKNPVASCAMPVREGMVIRTDNDKTHEAREAVMEFLLINHPLDCPICDEGGECDLQDQALAYGRSYTRYEEQKRAVADIDWGPLIKTHMTRCIHCMRCVRFASEVAGVEEIGSLGRGEDTKILPAIQGSLRSELSGNIIDLCPVGALTSKPYRAQARPWELSATHSIDVHDAMGSHLRIDARGGQVMRLLPRTCDDINEEWMTDKARFSYDGLLLQRLDRPWIRVNGKLQPATWQEAFACIKAKLTAIDPSRMAGLAGDLCCAESLFVMTNILDFYECANRDCREAGVLFDTSCEAGYLFGGGFISIEEADACLLVGTQLHLEAPLLHSRLLRRTRHDALPLAYLGASDTHRMKCETLGDDPLILEALIEQKHPFAAQLKKAKKPLIIAGMDAFKRPDGMAIHHALYRLAQKFNVVSKEWWGFNVVQRAASRIAALSLGFVPQKTGAATQEILQGAKNNDWDVLWLLGYDENITEDMSAPFTIYVGHHGDRGATIADVILPAAAYSEKTALYVNNEGRLQQALAAVAPVGEAREDWKILRALAEHLAIPLPYNDRETLMRKMAQAHKRFDNQAGWQDGWDAPQWKSFGKKATIEPHALQKATIDFYMTNPITRASKIMAQCSMIRQSEAA